MVCRTVEQGWSLRADLRLGNSWAKVGREARTNQEKAPGQSGEEAARMTTLIVCNYVSKFLNACEFGVGMGTKFAPPSSAASLRRSTNENTPAPRNWQKDVWASLGVLEGYSAPLSGSGT